MHLIENYDIQPSTVGITAVDGAGATWNADNWDLKPSAGLSYTIGPWSQFSLYLVGDDAAEMPADTRVRVVKRDITNEEQELIWAGLYAQVKEFADKKKRAYLGCTREVKIEESEHLVIQANGADATGTGDLDVSASHFKLASKRRRRALS